jgi:hypothetical protein
LVLFLVKKRKNSKEKKLLFVNIVNTHVRVVIPDFVMPVMQILVILALDVVKQIYKKKRLNRNSFLVLDYY